MEMKEIEEKSEVHFIQEVTSETRLCCAGNQGKGNRARPTKRETQRQNQDLLERLCLPAGPGNQSGILLGRAGRCGAGLREDGLGLTCPCEPSGEEEPLKLLADVALSPPSDGLSSCSHKDRCFHTIQLQLRFFLNEADSLQEEPFNSDDGERQRLVRKLSLFLYTCQPFFNFIEYKTRRSGDQCCKLQDFSQQLSDRLEHLMLAFAKRRILNLDETQPESISCFCVGESVLGSLRVTGFRYCRPTPYLAHFHTGLYKRMRWNVENLRSRADSQVEYYFLCYEDSLDINEEPDDQFQRTWSIGQWLQMDPQSDDIQEWITCAVPRASFRRLLFLGAVEPSCGAATDFLHQLLREQHR